MTVGIAPSRGDSFELIEGSWASAVAQGLNSSYQTVKAYATGGQTKATQIAVNASLVYISTVASGGDSVKLPAAKAGMVKMILNGTATSANVFGYNSTDTINGTVGSTAAALAGNKSAVYFCPKDGYWGYVVIA